jgi:hypothetical protein
LDADIKGQEIDGRIGDLQFNLGVVANALDDEERRDAAQVNR